MLAPVFLVLGAPVTLLLCALPVDSGRRGFLRRLILRLLHTRVMAILMHPGMTFFLLIGFIYFWAVLGIDPSPRTFSRGRRMVSDPVMAVLELAATAPFHAFFGVVLLMSTTMLVGFYSMPMYSWQASSLTDQVTGGAIAWTFMELPTPLS